MKKHFLTSVPIRAPDFFIPGMPGMKKNYTSFF